MALRTDFTVFLEIKEGVVLTASLPISGGDDTFTEVVGPRTLRLAPAPTAAIDLDFCNIITAKILMLETDGNLNLWLNADPLSDPVTHLLFKGPFFIKKDMTRIAVQNPGGLIDVVVKILFAGV